MKIIPTIPPRQFEVGFPEHRLMIQDCAHIGLDADEQVTFTTDSGSEYDVVRKNWGFYATPSLNGRLVNHNLHAALCKNRIGLFFILLVESGYEESFFEYLSLEKMDLVMWLDKPENFDFFNSREESNKNRLCCPICGNSHFICFFKYTSPPKGEIRFDFSKHNKYYREIMQCCSCSHFISIHEMDDSSLYSGDYVNSNYQDDNGIRKTYEKIMSLPPEKSDNTGRVKNILTFTNNYFSHDNVQSSVHRVLDVGSGLCVFLAKMKEAGWDCTAVDPDTRAIAHAVKNVGVRGICGDFLKIEINGTFDLITFNKVLEHVKDPEKMLLKTISNTSHGGLIYIEVPDGESAAMEGKEREEFFIDHPHIFSFSSLLLMVKMAGLDILQIERIREPSSKYTLRAFATRNPKSHRNVEMKSD